MRSLSSSLLAAQKAESVRPYLGSIWIKDLRAEVVRLHWAPVYSQGGPDMLSSIFAAADGNFVRVRVTSANNLYRQRVTNPAGSWGTWVLVSVGMYQSVRPWVFGNGASIYILAVCADGYTVRCWESGDYGATFPTVGTVCNDPSVLVQGVAGAVNWHDGSVKVFVAANPGGAGAQAYLRKYDRSGAGAWGTASSWGKPNWYGFSGLTCWFSGDWNLVATGQGPALGGTTDYPWQVAGLAFGAGFDVAAGAWSDPVVMRKSDLAAPFEYHHPSLCGMDVLRLTFVENYTGSGAYSRLMQAYRPAAGFHPEKWSEAIPFVASSSYGRALSSQSGDYVYSCDGDDVQRAQIGGTAASVDVSSRVIGYSSRQALVNGELLLELRNDDDALATVGQAGDPYEAIKRGSTVQISRGYVTGAGNESISLPYFTVERIEHVFESGVRLLRLHCGDGWSLLDGWKAERQYSWEGAQSVEGLLGIVCGFAGLNLVRAGVASPDSQIAPNFTIQPGESGSSAVRRLLVMMPEVLRWYGGHAVLVYLQESDASVYSYGGADQHIIRGGRFLSGSMAAGQVQVFGPAGVFGDALDYSELDLMGARVAKDIDYSLTLQADCANRAAGILSLNRQAASTGHIEVAPNVGQEIGDQVDLTVSSAGLSSVKRRVVGLEEEFRGNVFRQRILFGAREYSGERGVVRWAPAAPPAKEIPKDPPLPPWNEQPPKGWGTGRR